MWCKVTLRGAFVGIMGLDLLKQAFQTQPCSCLFPTAARLERADGSLHTSNGQQPDFPCAAIKESENNPHTLTITALAGAEFYPVKQNLYRHCKLSLPVSPSRHKPLIVHWNVLKTARRVGAAWPKARWVQYWEQASSWWNKSVLACRQYVNRPWGLGEPNWE